MSSAHFRSFELGSKTSVYPQLRAELIAPSTEVASPEAPLAEVAAAVAGPRRRLGALRCRVRKPWLLP